MIATPDQGCVESAGGVLGAGAGAGAGDAGLVLDGLAGAPGKVGTVRLCFCASGITRGPF
jgi:hypothetical protein